MGSDWVLAAVIAQVMLLFMTVAGFSGALWFMQAMGCGKMSEAFGRNRILLCLIPVVRYVPLGLVISNGRRASRVIWTVMLMLSGIGLAIALLLALPVSVAIENYTVELDYDMRYIGEAMQTAMWCIVALVVLVWRTVLSAGHLTVYLRCFKKWLAVVLGVCGVVLPVAPFALLAAAHRRKISPDPAEKEAAE